jgi:parvulin-like peptidyl-prolyl isomerase
MVIFNCDKKIVLLVFCFFSLNVLGQNIKEQIKLINTVEEANTFVQNYKDFIGEIIEISPEIEENTLFYNRKKGEIFTDENNIYKVLESNRAKAFKVNYIFLDGNKISSKSIDDLRKTILRKYQNGTPFIELAKEYTMDGNLNGNLGWFTEGMMVPEFENAIKNHKVNDIFTVDVPTEKWYYVTLKTFEEKEVESLTILKVNK